MANASRRLDSGIDPLIRTGMTWSAVVAGRLLEAL